MPAIDPRLLLSFFWIIGCGGAFFYLLYVRPNRLPKLPYIVLVALLLRLIPALALPRGAAYEIHLFQQTAQAFRAGKNIYIGNLAHPYLPLQLYWLALSDWLTQQVGLFFIFWLKLPSILADTAVTALIYLALRNTKNQPVAQLGSWLYVVNPVSILVCAYQGQFDAVPMLLLLTAWFLFQFYPQKRSGVLLSAILLGIGVWSKTWPIFFLPIVLLRLRSWQSRFTYTLLTGTMPLLGLIIYETLFPGSFIPIIQRALRAGAIPGWWGYSSIMNVFVELIGQGQAAYLWLTAQAKWATLLGGVLTIYFTRHRSALYSLLLTILTLFTLMPNLGLQGLSWIVPIAAILDTLDELGWYVLGVTLHMLISYWGIHLSQGLYEIVPQLWGNIIIQLSSLTAWIIVVIWCWQEIRRKQYLPPMPRPKN
ncbi:MAG: hypothetical protein GY805_30760 [Chloroflexi bacterium]|nr:hypothetical protein [Chloroflexota bacterium]